MLQIIFDLIFIISSVYVCTCIYIHVHIYMYASYKIYGYFGENKPKYEKDVKIKTLFSP